MKRAFLILSLLALVFGEPIVEAPEGDAHVEDRKVSIAIFMEDGADGTKIKETRPTESNESSENEEPKAGPIDPFAPDYKPDGDSRPYFATFDATSLSTEWQDMFVANYADNPIEEMHHQHDHSPHLVAGALEKVTKTLSAEAQPIPVVQVVPSDNGESTHDATLDSESEGNESAPQASVIEVEESKDENINKALQLTDQEKVNGAASIVRQLSYFPEMGPLNVMNYIRKGKPFGILVLCNCPRDYDFVIHLPELTRLLQEAQLEEKMSFMHIHPGAVARFRLDRTFQLTSSPTVVVGDSDTNVKKVLCGYGHTYSFVPEKIDVVVVDNIYDDRFELTVSEISLIGFVLTVRRTDKNEGWGQPLHVRYTVTPLHHQVPTLIVDNIPTGSNNEKSVFNPDGSTKVTPVNMFNFFNGLFEDPKNMPLLVKTQAKPLDPTKSVNPGDVRDVYSLTFHDIVLDPKKDVFLLVYSPRCPGSNAVQPLFGQLAQAMKEVDDKAIIARIDRTVNDIPIRGVTITHYPTALLFPAGDWDSDSYTIYDYSDFNGSKDPHNRNVPHNHYALSAMEKFVRQQGSNFEGEPMPVPTHPHHHHH